MNIFVLDKDPKKAATMSCDKHVVKMVLETAQVLCSALDRHGVDDTLYRPTHKKHPCTLWAGDSRANFMWLVEHGLALSEEYTVRYGKTHKSQSVIEWCAKFADSIPRGELTAFAQAMPPQYRHPDVVKAYRSYYQGEKSAIATWKTKQPSWWPEKE